MKQRTCSRFMMVKVIVIWAAVLFVMVPMMPAVSLADSIATAILKAGGDVDAAIQQAILAGEDPVAVAEAPGAWNLEAW